MKESNWGRWFSWVDKTGWPFAWILLIPMVTVGLQSGFLDDLLYQGHHCTLVEEDPSGVGADTWRCPREYVLPTLLPGLLNLVAFCWLESRRSEVRWAALVAGTLGALRLAVPMMIYAASGPNVEIYDFGGFVYGPGSSVFASWTLWGLSLFCAFVLLVIFVGKLIGRLGDWLWEPSATAAEYPQIVKDIASGRASEADLPSLAAQAWEPTVSEDKGPLTVAEAEARLRAKRGDLSEGRK